MVGDEVALVVSIKHTKDDYVWPCERFVVIWLPNDDSIHIVIVMLIKKEGRAYGGSSFLFRVFLFFI